MTSLSNDSIYFYRRVSSELDYDFLEFYIDNVLADKWSGEVNWGRVGFPVTPGQHTFKWVYSKDWYVVSGSDCAWIDNIEFPVAAGVVTGSKDPLPATDYFNIYPNPSKGMMEFTFNLKYPAAASIRLYNAYGALVGTITDRDFGMGSHSLSYDGHSLMPGVYLAVMESNGNKITRRLVVTK
jgi:hypothetical protein